MGLIPGQEDPLKKEMATHSSILAWRIPWTEDPGRLQSMELQRVGCVYIYSEFPCRQLGLFLIHCDNLFRLIEVLIPLIMNIIIDMTIGIELNILLLVFYMALLLFHVFILFFFILLWLLDVKS